QWGWAAEVVGSGEEALEKAAAIRPGLALMDIRLKGRMDGVDTAARLWQEFGIPVVYVTGCADEAVLREARGSNNLGILVKPFHSEELRGAISTALERLECERQEGCDSPSRSSCRSARLDEASEDLASVAAERDRLRRLLARHLLAHEEHTRQIA